MNSLGNSIRLNSVLKMQIKLLKKIYQSLTVSKITFQFKTHLSKYRISHFSQVFVSIWARRWSDDICKTKIILGFERYCYVCRIENIESLRTQIFWRIHNEIIHKAYQHRKTQANNAHRWNNETWGNVHLLCECDPLNSKQFQ